MIYESKLSWATESSRPDIIVDNIEKKLCSNAVLLKDYEVRSPNAFYLTQYHS